MPTSTIPALVATELQRQFNYEFAAAHAYKALSIWCEVRNLDGFAAFFEKQAGEEHAHAEKMMEHLIDRGVSPVLVAVPQPRQAFESLAQVAECALSMEQANTKGINAVYEAALASKDYPAQVLMHWFINEQVEEEAWGAEMIERIATATCAGSMAELDRHIVRYLTEGE
ncbi:MAG TPA: ferritin [Bryobacteraceae bacterium]|nr:ferritin [Bryobacteraceae bacterium]